MVVVTVTVTESALSCKLFHCSCGCYFLTAADVRAHQARFGKGSHRDKFDSVHKKLEQGGDSEEATAVWKSSSFGGGVEILPVDAADPELLRLVHGGIGGWVTIGCNEYSLSSDGKWLKKRRLMG